MNCTNCKDITLFKGSDGRTIYNDSGAPTLTTANAGDFYIDTTAWEIYGPYTGSSWGSGTSLIGPAGSQGVYGGWSSEWDYDNNTGTGTGNEEFRFNNASPASVTALYVNNINGDNTDLSAFLTAWDNSGAFGFVRISKKDDANTFWLGIINSVTVVIGEHQYGVTTVASNGTFSDGDAFIISYVGKGATGATPDVGLYSQTARSTTIVNTTAPSTLIGSGVGSLIFGANTLQVGDSFRADMRGDINVGATPANLTIEVLVNATVLASVVMPMSTATNTNWDLSSMITVRTAVGVGSVVAVSGEFRYKEDSSNKHEGFYFANVSGALDTSISNTLEIRGTWSVADVTNSIESGSFVLTKEY